MNDFITKLRFKAVKIQQLISDRTGEFVHISLLRALLTNI